MAASNAGVYEKIVILDEYLVLASITAGSLRVINIWTVPNCHRKIFAPPPPVWRPLKYRHQLRLGHRSAIVQNITPIGGKVAEISVPGDKEKTKNYSRFNIRHNAILAFAGSILIGRD